MTGIPVAIAELGIKAAAGKALGSIGSGIGSAASGLLKWFLSLDLIHMLALGLAIAAAYEFVLINGLEFKLIPFLGPEIHFHSLKGKIAAAQAETDKADASLAAALDKLSASEKNEAALRAEIGKQNGAIASIATASAQSQQAGTKAEIAAQARASTAEARAAALRDAARHQPAAPGCKTSKALEDAWK